MTWLWKCWTAPLRDGGYINNWEFGRHAMASILDKLEAAGIEIIECGFLTNRPPGRGLLPVRRAGGHSAPAAPGASPSHSLWP